VRVAELIELIQTHLPEELTPEQIEDIRAKMADSPELQEALLEELSIEQGLATQHAPAPKDYGEVIARIEALSVQRTRRHWLVWGLTLVLSLGLLAGGAAMLIVAREPVEPTEDPLAMVPPSPPAPTTGPAAGPDPVGPGPAIVIPGIGPLPGPGVGRGPQTRPTAGPAAGETARLGWQEYLGPDTLGNHQWREGIEQPLRPHGGA